MEELRVGGQFPARLSGEGTFFETTPAGLTCIFNYHRPSPEEIRDVSEGSAFEIRFTTLYGVLWVFVKCGAQEWAEAPYSPHLSKAPQLEPITDDEHGYALTLVMVDMATNEIKHLRVIGLGAKFSHKLKAAIDELAERPFTRSGYDMAVRRAQTALTTKEMVQMCRDYWRVK